MNVTIVIPTYNERENVTAVAEAVLQQGPYRVLIVDDDSPDGTGAVADALAARYPGAVDVLHRRGRQRGFRQSYVDGFVHALAAGADLICQMDADLSHDPKYIPAFVEATERYDVVIGSRYADGISVVNWPLRRLILSVGANRYIQLITRLPISDCTSGFRCWRRSVLSSLPLTSLASNGYAFQVEMLFEAVRRGARIGEVPIIFIERRHGRSKLSKGMIVESVFMPWRLIARRRTRVQADAVGREAAASGKPR
jgi:dolichol-phosphate mannosyltransferase